MDNVPGLAEVVPLTRQRGARAGPTLLAQGLGDGRDVIVPGDLSVVPTADGHVVRDRQPVASPDRGALTLSAAPNLVIGLVGLIVAAAGTAVLFPTLIGVVSGRVQETHRGRATSTVTTVAYLGFLLGPVYVGFWAGTIGIRGAMVAVAALGTLLLLTTPIVRPAPSRTTVPNHSASRV